MSKIKVTKIKSGIGAPPKVRAILESMGLRKMWQTREYKDTNCIRGMVNKVKNYVRYELVD